MSAEITVDGKKIDAKVFELKMTNDYGSFGTFTGNTYGINPNIVYTYEVKAASSTGEDWPPKADGGLNALLGLEEGEEVVAFAVRKPDGSIDVRNIA
jgi:hypothetical protein